MPGRSRTSTDGPVLIRLERRPHLAADTAERPELGSPRAATAREAGSTPPRTDRGSLAVVSPLVGDAGRHPAGAHRGRACPRGLPVLVLPSATSFQPVDQVLGSWTTDRMLPSGSFNQAPRIPPSSAMPLTVSGSVTGTGGVAETTGPEQFGLCGTAQRPSPCQATAGNRCPHRHFRVVVDGEVMCSLALPPPGRLPAHPILQRLEASLGLR
jgi:hypothetical protein